MLADRPLRDDERDELGFAPYADALAELIDNPATDTPLTIAISAPWGAGKTSLAHMIERRLISRPRERGEPSHITAWFNAWMHDDAPHLGAAFAADVAKAANRQRRLWRRVLTPLPSEMLSAQERWRRRVALAIGALVVALLLGTFVPGLRDLFVSSKLVPRIENAFGARLASLTLMLVGLFMLWTRLFSAAKAAASFVDDPRSEAARGSMRDVSGQLGVLVRQATRGKRKLVIFVDDLERCRPPRAVEVCEVASQLLGHEGVVTVLVADMSVIATSAAIKYAELDAPVNGGGPDREAYGRLYLEKMVQIEFALPAVRAENVSRLVRSEGRGDDAVGATRAPEERAPGPSPAMAVPAVVAVVLIGTTVISGLIGAVVAIFPSLLPEARTSATATTTTLGDWFAYAAAALGGVAAVATFVGRLVRVWRDRRAQGARARVDEAIHEARQAGVTDAEELRERVLETAGKSTSPELAEHRIQRYVTERSQERAEAERWLTPFLPRLPRAAKRMLNHLRVLLVVAHGRGLLTSTSALRPQHLAKWVVLNERWPALARLATTAPDVVAQLERQREPEIVEARLARYGLEVEALDDLLALLRRAPELGSSLDCLIHLDPTDRKATGAVAM